MVPLEPVQLAGVPRSATAPGRGSSRSPVRLVHPRVRDPGTGHRRPGIRCSPERSRGQAFVLALSRACGDPSVLELRLTRPVEQVVELPGADEQILSYVANGDPVHYHLATSLSDRAPLPAGARDTGFHRGTRQVWVDPDLLHEAVWLKSGGTIRAMAIRPSPRLRIAGAAESPRDDSRDPRLAPAVRDGPVRPGGKRLVRPLRQRYRSRYHPARCPNSVPQRRPLRSPSR